jgi:hypothetical protein
MRNGPPLRRAVRPRSLERGGDTRQAISRPREGPRQQTCLGSDPGIASDVRRRRRVWLCAASSLPSRSGWRSRRSDTRPATLTPSGPHKRESAATNGGAAQRSGLCGVRQHGHHFAMIALRWALRHEDLNPGADRLVGAGAHCRTRYSRRLRRRAARREGAGAGGRRWPWVSSNRPHRHRQKPNGCVIVMA